MIVHETLAEIYGCTRLLEDGEALKRLAREAVVSQGATVVGASEVHYVPHGLTIALFLAESHIILTTWPELGLLLVDVMLCNPAMDCCRVLDRIQEAVAPQGSRVDHHVPRALARTPHAATTWPHAAEAAVQLGCPPLSATPTSPPQGGRSHAGPSDTQTRPLPP